MHALIIEQDTWVALMIENILLDLGYTSFDVAVSADDAFALASETCPDLITSTVRVGPACGIDTVRTICSHHPIPSVFVVSNGQELRERKADMAVVHKPFAVGDFEHAIGCATARPPAD